jgi:multidrug efflux pump subunit AcrB
MMCVYLLRPSVRREHGFLYILSERGFVRVQEIYRVSLTWTLKHPALVLLSLVATLALNVYLIILVPKGLFPTQDTGLIFGGMQGSQDASFQSMRASLLGGLRRGLLQQYKAQYEADTANYRQTVLTAFQQVEDGLSTNRLLGRQMQEQQEVTAAAQRYYHLSDVHYRTGVDTYLNVFTAETSLLSSQETEITLKVQQMTNSVQMIEALGGGWDDQQLPSEKAVARK